MKIRLLAFALITLWTTETQAQTKSNQSTKKENKRTMENTSTAPVKQFFAAFGNGDFNGLINTFHDSCTISAVRESERAAKEIYGTYKGKEGAKEFIMNLGNAFDTKAFTVENIVGENNVAFANGKFTHQLKSTGKLFSSDWSLMCKIRDGKIYEYHFYEDSAKYAEANMN